MSEHSTTNRGILCVWVGEGPQGRRHEFEGGGVNVLEGGGVNVLEVGGSIQ